MQRRTLLKAAAGAGLFAVIGKGLAGCAGIPVIPSSPDPDALQALGWIRRDAGRYTLTLPRAELGQNIATAMKQIACAELGVGWEEVEVQLYDTTAPPSRATVGSESVMDFAEPLAQACAALRDAVAAGRSGGEVEVAPRPRSALRAFRREGLIGRSPALTQGREIVTGRPLFASDVRRNGMMYGRVLRAPVAVEVDSRPEAWNTDAARLIPGFVAVVEDCGPRIGRSQGLGIVARTPGALDDIESALNVEWDIDGNPENALIDDALDVDRRLARGSLSNTVMSGRRLNGPTDVDLRLDIAPAAHGPIEPRVAVAEWDGDSVTVWTGTQDAFYVRDVLADDLGVSKDAVRVQTCRVGGAFGGKTICTVEAEVAPLARAVGAPVKVQWTRSQEYHLGFHRPPSSHRVKALVENGRITGWDHAQASSHVIYTAAVLPGWMQWGTDLFAGDDGVARGMKTVYDFDDARATYDLVRLPFHTGPWRGLGAGPNGLAIESAMDEAALAAQADPLSFRLDHIDDPRLAGVLNRVAEISGWEGSAAQSGDDRRRGRGVACGVYKEVSYVAVVADVAVSPTGQVEVTGLWCAHDCGLVINPDQVRAQCEGNLAWSLGMVLTDDLPIRDGRVVAETFADAPIPRMQDLPPIEVSLIESDLAPVGAGETGIAAGPGAVANAIRAATGIRPTRFPVQASTLAVQLE